MSTLRTTNIVLVVIQLVILVVMLFQINSLNSKIDFITGLATGTNDGEEDTEPSIVEVSEDDDAWTGGKNAKVVIIEFSDYQCPYCSRAKDTMDQLLEVYGDDIKLVFRDFPLSFHENAQKAAEASECAGEQDKFWEMYDKLFANQAALDVASLKQYAVDLGLDAEKFNTCLDSGEMADEVKKDFNEGASYGVKGTPAFFINGQLISGAQPIENFKAIIDAEL